jgi:predicted NBD/HSP70 family sugar kinase
MAGSIQKSTIKDNNLQTIFRIIQRYGPLERKHIQEYSKLSWGTVSKFTALLEQAKIIVQNPNPVSNVGKTPSLLDINGEDHYIVGVDLNFRDIRIVIVDLKGNIIRSQIAGVPDSSQMIQLLLERLETTIQPYLANKNLIAISIATQGNIDSEKGIALYLTFAPTWRNIRLKEIVEEKFDIPTYIFHDLDCVLIAEKYFGNSIDVSYRTVIALNTNYGIGMSLMINSQIYAGANHRSGELGHSVAVPNGALCSCGKRGCLEAYASKVGITNRFIDAVNNGTPTMMNVADSFSIKYDSIKRFAKSGDLLCQKLFEEAAFYLGISLASLASVLDPDVIIFFGELADDRELFQEKLYKVFSENVYPGNTSKIIFSSLKGSAVALGASFYALDEILSGFLKQKTGHDDEDDQAA